MQTIIESSYLSFFPKDSSPRESQKVALKKIENAFKSGKKFVIASLPTGSGKSHIASSVGNSSEEIDSYRKNLIDNYSIYKKDKSGNGYEYQDAFLNEESFGSVILTVTKSLQEQYKSLFSDISVLKGKSNYSCDIDPNIPVDFAPCLYTPNLKESCFAMDRCPYYKARKEALLSKDPILNYRVFMNLPEFLRKREIYICDEASDIEDEIVSQYTLNISYSNLLSYNIEVQKLKTEKSQDVLLWLNGIFIKIESEIEKLKSRLSKQSKDSSENTAIFKRDTQNLSKINLIYNSISEILQVFTDCNYIVESKDSDGVTLVPLDIKPIARKLFRGADMVLMMSATITNHYQFAKTLGISEGEYEYIEVPSAFNPQKSPIKTSQKYSLSYKNKNKDLPNILGATLYLCEQHKGEKGIIHTHTNAITQELKRMVGKNDRFIFRDIGYNNESVIKEHCERLDDSIIVSPSMDTGISLDGDLGRFQVIVKAPFLPLNSKRIKHIYEINKEYYMMKMLNTLVQMSGRCTRSKEDFSVTYILDGNAVNSIIRNKNILPKCFLDRIF